MLKKKYLPLPKLIGGLLFVVLLLVLSACPSKQYRYPGSDIGKGETLSLIREKGSLTAITEYSPTTYFIYRGEPMGFQYELLSRFAEHLGVDLDLRISENLNSTFKSLIEKEVQLIAMDLTVTRDRSKVLGFVHPHNQTRQVLVQRKASAWQNEAGEDRPKFIRNPLDLAGKVVYIQKGSSFLTRLKNLQDEIGDTIHIIEHPTQTAEVLIRRVAEGEIDYTVSDENVAMINKTWYPQLDIKTAISFPQKLAWAVNKEADSLMLTLNTWMDDFVKTSEYRVLFDKYFKSKKILNIAEEEFISGEGGKISVYDDIIRKHSDIVGWDWRLIASLIYQESRFHPEVRAWTGAFGLMQLMPETAAELGVDSLSSPEEQIRAGIQYLKNLDDQLTEMIPDPEERIKFTLAAYNVGIGHVLDARRLADKNGYDTNLWFQSVDTFLLMKSQPEAYNDPVVYYGYCRGSEPVAFVSEIMARYKLYLDVIGE